MGRSSICKETGLKRGTWTTEEDRLLIAYVRRYGHSNWRHLPSFAGLSRCGKSCRLRWLNYLQPNVKRGNFTGEEDEIIQNMHSMLGNKWATIAACLPGRTDNEIKNHWHTHLKKRYTSNSNLEEAKGKSIHCGTHTKPADPGASSSFGPDNMIPSFLESSAINPKSTEFFVQSTTISPLEEALSPYHICNVSDDTVIMKDQAINETASMPDENSFLYCLSPHIEALSPHIEIGNCQVSSESVPESSKNFLNEIIVHISDATESDFYDSPGVVSPFYPLGEALHPYGSYKGF